MSSVEVVVDRSRKLGVYLRLHIVITRKKVVAYAYSILALILVFNIVLAQQKVESTKIQRKHSTVSELLSQYFKSFTDKDFETCDSMVSNSKDKILGYELGLLGTSTLSVDMYKALFSACADSIDEVKVVKGEKNTFTIKTVFSTVKQYSDIQCDETGIKKLFKNYINGSIDNKDFKARLKKYYQDSFNRTVLSEKVGKSENEYSVTIKNGKISGIYGYLVQLMKDMGYYSNIEVYEESIESTFSVYLNE